MNQLLHRRIVIFTVGFHARASFRFLVRQETDEVLGFVDNNPATHGTTLFGLPVWSPRQLGALDFDLVAVPGRHQQAITDQLRDQWGLASARVWRVRKSEVPPAPDELARRGGELARLLHRTLAVLDAAGCRHWAMHSSLLGLRRGQELALFSDVDLAVESSDFAALGQRLREEGLMVNVTRRPTDDSVCEISLKFPSSRVWDEPAVVDLHPLILDEGDATWLVNGSPLSMPARFFSSHNLAEYRGVSLRIPSDADAMLAALYGDDWRQPAETWNGRYVLPPLAAPAPAS
jgi:hypothetical protein